MGKVNYIKREEFELKNDTRKISSLKEQLEWIKRQIEYATFTDSFKLRMELHKGEIYEIKDSKIKIFDDKHNKIGYEIPFTRIFYKFVKPRSSEEVFNDFKVLSETEKDLMDNILGAKTDEK